MSDPSRLDRVVKAYDIRGIVPEEIDETIAYAIGSAFARFAAAHGAHSILIGRDMRASGVSLSAALASGVTNENVQVSDLGLCSTDLLYYASGATNSPGVMLTASHNPARYNGMKLCLQGAAPIGEESGLLEIKRLAGERLLELGDNPPPPARAEFVRKRDLLPQFAAHVRSFVDYGDLRPLRVVADTANGMGGLIAPAVFADLPFQLDVLYGELDGNFPNHPADPIQEENLTDLKSRVLHSGADVGLAFDGDADRVFLIDEKGVALSGSTTTAIVADVMLERSPGATVLYNCICSKAVEEVIAEAGGVGVRTRVGHSFIKAVMKETGAVFGGEHSGHYYFKDNYRADSGIIAALVVLGLLSKTKQNLSSLRVPYERYADSGEINREVADPSSVIAHVEREVIERGASTDHLDGLTAQFPDWWFNLRPSNTEPLLRLNVEANDAEALAARIGEITELIDRYADSKGA